MGRRKKELRINNAVVIQYQTKKGDMKVLAFSDYDVQKLMHRTTIHMGTKRVLSIQFYYDISTNKDIHLIAEGVILK